MPALDRVRTRDHFQPTEATITTPESLIDSGPPGPKVWQIFVLLALFCTVCLLDLVFLNAYFEFSSENTPHRILGAVLWFGIPFVLKCAALGYSAYGVFTCRDRVFWYGIGACVVFGFVPFALFVVELISYLATALSSVR